MRPVVSRSELEPAHYGLSEEQAAWLKQKLEDARLPEKPSVADIDRLEKAGGLTDHQRRILDAVRRSVVGNLRSTAGVAFGKEGRIEPGAQKAWTLRVAKVPTHSLDKDKAFQAELEPYLIGQKGVETAFKRFFQATKALARQVPPMMVIGGELGHGKEQALEGLAKALFGEAATVITVALDRITDDQIEAVFSAGGRKGDLSLPNLMEIEDNKLGIVRLTGLEKLKDRAPGVADELVKRLGARKGEPEYAKVPFVIDFDVPPGADLPQILEDALGPVAVRLRAAQAAFGRLDKEAMLEYLDIALPQILQQPGLGQLQIEWDEDARDAFGEILATPHQPLEELQFRLQTLILDQFDASETPADAVMRVHLLEDDPANRQASIEYLKSERADLLDVPPIFTVTEEGRVADPKVVAGLVEDAEQSLDQILQRSTHHQTEVRRLFPEYERLEQLSDALGSLESSLKALARQRGRLVIPERTDEALLETIRGADVLVAQLAKIPADRQAELGFGLSRNLAVALASTLEGVRLIARTPELLKGEEPSIAQLQKYTEQLGRGIKQLDELKAQLPMALAARNDLSGDLAEFSRKWIQALDAAKESQRDGLYPLILEDEARALIKMAQALEARLPLQAPGKGGRNDAIRRLFESSPEAKKDLKALTKALSISVEIAENLGGLAAVQRKTIAQAHAEETADSPSARRTMAKALIRTENGATEVDKRVVMAELVKLPLRVLKRLARQEIPVVVMRGKITEFLKDLPKGARPPGYPEGKTYDDIPAIYVNGSEQGNKQGKAIVIVTKEQNGNVILPGLDTKRGQNPVIHESFHAFDDESYFSGSKEFQAMREAERHALSEYEKQAKEGNFDRGAAETFAITGERLFGGDATVRKERPKLTGYMESITKDPDAEK